jgi:hypothetical protein
MTCRVAKCDVQDILPNVFNISWPLANTTLLVSCYDSKMKTITLPKGSPDPLPELAAYLEPFAPLFRRSTSRRSLERYVTGLLSDLPFP